MSALATLTLAGLVSVFNDAIPANSLPVQPVKKFASKEAAIKRIDSLCVEYGLEVVDDGGFVKLVAMPSEDTVEDPSVEAPEESVTVEDPAVEGGEASVPSSDAPALLTDLQYRVMNRIAHAEHNTTNGATPTQASDVNTWLWGDLLADETGLTPQQVGGVLTSLEQGGFINIVDAGTEEAGVSFTQAGFDSWQIHFQFAGHPDRLETPPVDAPAEAVASGFKYLTREELAALAETDPAARAAYRMARRKAARAARKAKKGWAQ